jgi:tetratricopeptide (TPR) repeat protein
LNRKSVLIALLVTAGGLGAWRGPGAYNQYQALTINKKADDKLFGGQVVEAQELYRQAVAKDPTIFGSWVGLATSYAEQRKFQLAVESCDQGLKFHPTKCELYKIKGEALEKLDKFSEAVEAYEAGLKVDSEDSLVRRLRDRASKKSQKPTK